MIQLKQALDQLIFDLLFSELYCIQIKYPY